MSLIIGWSIVGALSILAVTIFDIFYGGWEEEPQFPPHELPFLVLVCVLGGVITFVLVIKYINEVIYEYK